MRKLQSHQGNFSSQMSTEKKQNYKGRQENNKTFMFIVYQKYKTLKYLKTISKITSQVIFISVKESYDIS